MEGPRAPAESLQICGCSGGVDPVGQATSLPIQREKRDKSHRNWCLGTLLREVDKTVKKLVRVHKQGWSVVGRVRAQAQTHIVCF